MNLAKTHLFSALKSSTNRNPVLRPTITLSILESHLRICRSCKQFLQIHAQMTVSALIKDTFAASRLMGFSTTSPLIDLDYSYRLLYQIECPNGFIWNSLIRACVQRNSSHWCLPLYKSMLVCGVLQDNYTYPILVQASSIRMCIHEGKQIHGHVIRLGFDSDVYVQNTLINMYSVCGDVEDARVVFDKSAVLDSVSWNSILAAYVQSGEVEEAHQIFNQMPERNVIAANSMIVLFGKFGRVKEACELFDSMTIKDIVSWTAMICCYEQNEMFAEALDMFFQMNSEGLFVDEIVMVSVLSACAQVGAFKEGELIHGLVVKSGLEDYMNIQNALIHLYSSCECPEEARRLFDSSSCLDQISWNSMINCYLKCGSVEKAKEIFDAMPQKDVVSWSTMISGYAQHNQYAETLELFNEMQAEAISPDETTLVSVISACARSFALEQGRWVHTYIRRKRYEINVFLGTTLVDMYMKCGCVDTAREVFDEMKEKGVSTWNAVILGLAMNGQVKDSLIKFSEMEVSGVSPNDRTFVGVLGACRHAGLVDEGRHLFESMRQTYKIAPNVRHYGCMVDLLGRAGLLREAEVLIGSMPMAPDVATWGALLGACRKHGATEIGERLGRRLIELEPEHDGFHVLLSNIYASKGMWNNVMELRVMMKQRGVVKIPGCSMIEFNGKAHQFLAGDKTHPQMEEIKNMLEEMARRLKMEGYEPLTAEVAFDIEEEEKETSLYMHSEKLAIAFGLISICPPMPIRIMKNLRICSDCHEAAKIISRAFEREIIIRDRHRFHHFKQGVCSCTEFW